MNHPNIDRIHDVFAAFGRGDVQHILNHLTDDVQWVSHMDPIVPWSGDFSGVGRVPAFFEAIFENVDVLGFEPLEFYAEQATVISIGTFSCRSKETGRDVTARWVFIFRFRNDRISSYEQFQTPNIADIFRG